MKNRFEKYVMYIKVNGKITDVNRNAFKLADDAFSLFKSLYNTNYGTIDENDNLIAIHTGGWSDNEELIREFQETVWWIRNHKITAKGGHYYFNTDSRQEKEWVIVVKTQTML